MASLGFPHYLQNNEDLRPIRHQIIRQIQISYMFQLEPWITAAAENVNVIIVERYDIRHKALFRLWRTGHEQKSATAAGFGGVWVIVIDVAIPPINTFDYWWGHDSTLLCFHYVHIKNSHKLILKVKKIFTFFLLIVKDFSFLHTLSEMKDEFYSQLQKQTIECLQKVLVITVIVQKLT